MDLKVRLDLSLFLELGLVILVKVVKVEGVKRLGMFLFFFFLIVLVKDNLVVDGRIMRRIIVEDFEYFLVIVFRLIELCILYIVLNFESKYSYLLNFW